LFNYGMKVLVSRAPDHEWRRDGTQIEYKPNNFRRENCLRGSSHSTLTFSLSLPENEWVYIAYCFPYTHKTLQSDLADLRSPYMAHSTLCKTLGGKKVDLLTITDVKGDPSSKKGVVLTARTHPGESNSSWVMKGVLEFLLSEEAEAVLLRRHFVFKIVPMINVDGVIHGNYRTSLAGIDLNRTWKRPTPTLFPETHALKKMVGEFHAKHPIVLYTDLHGHSRSR